jgi:multiple sugar transport system substrate-binding protein
MNRFVAGATAASALLVLTACGTGSSSPAGTASGGTATSGAASSGAAAGGSPVTLKLVAPDYGSGPADASATYWKTVTDDFTKANPNIKVETTVINWNDLATKVATMVQNGQQPDVYVGGDYAGFVKDKLLYPVSDVLSPATQQNLLKPFADKGIVDGTAYGIPFVSSARALFYNKDLVPTAPTTWDQIKTAADAVKAKGKIGFGLPLGSEEAQAETMLWELGNGGGYTDASGKWTIDSPANVATFSWLQGLVKAGDTEPNPANKNRTDLWKQFASGQIGMINGSPALLPIIKSTNAKLNFGVAAVAGKTGPLTTTLGVADFLMAFNKSGHKDAIKKFLDFTYSDTNQTKFDLEYSLLPVTTSATAALQSDANLKPFLTALPTATFYPFTDPAWTPVSAQIKQIIGTALTGDPAKVLGQIQATATKK